MIFPHRAVRFASQAHHDIAQNPIVHVFASLPHHLTGIDSQLIALLNVIVQKGRQQIIGRGDGVEIPGEMQV